MPWVCKAKENNCYTDLGTYKAFLQQYEVGDEKVANELGFLGRKVQGRVEKQELSKELGAYVMSCALQLVCTRVNQRWTKEYYRGLEERVGMYRVPKKRKEGKEVGGGDGRE